MFVHAMDSKHNCNTRHRPTKALSRWRICVIIGLAFFSAILTLPAPSFNNLSRAHHLARPFHKSKPSNHQSESLEKLEEFRECSARNFQRTGLPFLKSASALPVQEFVDRRDRLAATLSSDKIDAFVVEPGYTFQYYANISQKDWEVWEPEERPFLMVIKPQEDPESGQIRADTAFLVPSFEAERARLLGMPFADAINLVEWQEHWNPYSTLLESTFFSSSLSKSRPTPKIMVDEEMRDFIQRGLGESGFTVVGLSTNVERIRQIKSPRELGILKAANTGTVEAVRQMRKCLYRGLTEKDVQETLDATLRVAGLEPFFDIVLFDDDASNPHGGTNGSKKLEEETLVLIDVGAHLYDYSSDISRTFFPPYVPKPTDLKVYQALSATMKEKLKVWDIVLEAQSQSIKVMKPNLTAAGVDLAARKVINDAGYKKAFTHRLGHGIGIKAHESPYLNKGNVNVTLSAGMVFTSEPGIYLVDKFGVRHEDVLLVLEDSEPEVLSGKRAKGPWEP